MHWTIFIMYLFSIIYIIFSIIVNVYVKNSNPTYRPSSLAYHRWYAYRRLKNTVLVCSGWNLTTTPWSSPRACDVPPHPAALHPRAGALHVLHAGNGLLVPRWRRGPSPAHQGGDGGHPGGHHRAQRVRVPPLHVGQAAPAQVGPHPARTSWSRE